MMLTLIETLNPKFAAFVFVWEHVLITVGRPISSARVAEMDIHTLPILQLHLRVAGCACPLAALDGTSHNTTTAIGKDIDHSRRGRR